jgi:hypothetical protein
VLTASLVTVAFVAGLAGGWSPCGLSMVETLAAGRRATRAAGALAFTAGALAGGVVTFGGLAALGAWLGAGGAAAAAVAVAALLTAAAGDAAGRRIIPQVRRQVPESWRRIMPLPLASGLYGVLLGLGFTTFVLSFATWGLAAACLAVGAPATGVAVGIAFAAGRAVPVVALAPLLASAMAERPGVLRGLRAVAAAGLAAAAATLLVAPPAARAQTFVDPGTDPSASGTSVAWQGSGGQGLLARDGQVFTLPGRKPALAGDLVAWLADGTIVIADARTLTPQVTLPAPGADALGLSTAAVAWRSRLADGRDAIFARSLAGDPNAPTALAGVARRGGGTLGRPAVTGTQVVFDSQSRDQSRLLARDITTGALTVLRRTRNGVLLNPSVDGARLLYVHSTARRQRVRLGAYGRRSPGRDRSVYSTTPTARRDAGREKGRHDHRAGYPDGRRPPKPQRPRKGVTVTLWTTAVSGVNAYVTRLRHRAGGVTEARILRLVVPG